MTSQFQRHSRLRRPLNAAAVFLLAATCACVYPHTRPLQHPPPNQSEFDVTTPGPHQVKIPQYYFPVISRGPRNTDRTFVVLAFSGGGTRAAALAYGVLDELRRIQIDCTADGPCERTLLDEVDVISSTSGGSFTSAYYALYGDQIFDPNLSFHRKFLKYNVQRELIGEAVYYPQSWPRLLKRVEIAASLYSRTLFEGKTYGVLANRPRPFVILNAADYVSQKRFEFTQDKFDLLCADLNEFPIARAVAASSAFPGLLNSMTIDAFNKPKGRCPVERPEPDWLPDVAKSQNADRIAYRQYQDYLTFTDPDRKYLHLLDGGLADNLGLRSIYEALHDAPAAMQIATLLRMGHVDNMLIVIVNARTGEQPTKVSNRAVGPLTPQVLLGATAGIPMGTVTYDSVDMLTELLDARRQAQKDIECCLKAQKAQKPTECCPPGDLSNALKGKIYAVELTFDNIEDEPTRRFFKSLSTDFALPPDIVDCLISEGRQLLFDSFSYGTVSAAFKDYVRDSLKGRMPALPDSVKVTGKRCSVVPARP